MNSGDRRPLKVFFSYSHEDEELRDQLDAHLAMLKRSDIIEVWHDRKIPAGHAWDPEIAGEIESSDVILLLISSDFLNSEFCYSTEVKRAMERHNAKEASVIPIALRLCDWAGAPFAKVQGLPKDFHPVTSWPNRDEAFTDIAKGIRWTVELLAGQARPAEISAAFESRPAPNQSNVVMSVGIEATLQGKPVSYASNAELNEHGIDSGRTNTVIVSLESLPPNGYAGFDVYVYCPSMIYEEALNTGAIVWPDSTFAARSFAEPGSIMPGAAIGIGVNASYYLGPLVKLSLRCPFENSSCAHSHSVYLVAHGELGPASGVVDETLTMIPAASIGRGVLASLGRRDIASILTVTCQPVVSEVRP